ncbi:putative nucleic acid-binding protein [Lupinus albus]|uniref:Putative nucleic acid-binding protein n=1 Tax=Lupinus albus TaxID=3870 RepID=A0A6A4QN03_LUPAL|nr:putative nucleic acid-binding protein [Lupinus albus]
MSASHKCDMIKDINDSKQQWKIVVRIANRWYVQMPPRSGHLDMILMDEQGDIIYVSVLRATFNEWRHYLVEDRSYMMQNFDVLPNDLEFKYCDHLYRLEFNGSTTTCRIDFPDIPLFQYDFKKISDILSGKFSTHLYIG